jgi:hypothetical protein
MPFLFADSRSFRAVPVQKKKVMEVEASRAMTIPTASPLALCNDDYRITNSYVVLDK